MARFILNHDRVIAAEIIYTLLWIKKKEKHASKIMFLPIGPQKLHGCV